MPDRLPACPPNRLPVTVNVPENPFLRLQSRYLVFATFLAVNLIILLPFWTIEQAGLLPDAVDPMVGTILEIISRGVIAAVVLWVLRSEGVRLKQLFGPGLLRSKVPHFSIAYGLVLVLSLLMFSLGIASIFFYLVSLAFPSYAALLLENTSILEGIESRFPGLYNGLVGLLVIVIAPVVEELIFRGVLLQRWATKWGMRKALVASSLLFGLLHINNPVGLTLFGLVMGLLYVRTRSLWVPIFCHGLNNLAAVGIVALNHAMASDRVAVTVEDMQAGWEMGSIMVLVSLPFLWRFVRRSWPRARVAIPYMINVVEG